MADLGTPAAGSATPNPAGGGGAGAGAGKQPMSYICGGEEGFEGREGERELLPCLYGM
jgi:hypothetical protein